MILLNHRQSTQQKLYWKDRSPRPQPWLPGGSPESHRTIDWQPEKQPVFVYLLSGLGV